jgi:hypothetical protein
MPLPREDMYVICGGGILILLYVWLHKGPIDDQGVAVPSEQGNGQNVIGDQKYGPTHIKRLLDAKDAKIIHDADVVGPVYHTISYSGCPCTASQDPAVEKAMLALLASYTKTTIDNETAYQAQMALLEGNTLKSLIGGWFTSILGGNDSVFSGQDILGLTQNAKFYTTNKDVENAAAFNKTGGIGGNTFNKTAQQLQDEAVAAAAAHTQSNVGHISSVFHDSEFTDTQSYVPSTITQARYKPITSMS